MCPPPGPGPEGSATNVFDGGVEWGLFVYLRDGRESFSHNTCIHLHRLGICRVTLAWPCFLMSFWGGFGVALGAHLTSNLVPFSSQDGPQEPPRMHLKMHLVLHHFFDRFLFDFWLVFDPQGEQKSKKKQSNNTTSKT